MYLESQMKKIFSTLLFFGLTFGQTYVEGDVVGEFGTELTKTYVLMGMVIGLIKTPRLGKVTKNFFYHGYQDLYQVNNSLVNLRNSLNDQSKSIKIIYQVVI